MNCFQANNKRLTIKLQKQKKREMEEKKVDGFTLSDKAKRVDEMTEAEKATLGTIQKAMEMTLNEALKGKVNDEQLQEKLNGLMKEVEEKQMEAKEKLTEEYEAKLKEATDIIASMQKNLAGLSEEIEKAKQKEVSSKENTLRKGLKEAFGSEKFKSFSNGTSKSTGEFDIDLKSLRNKEVSVTGNYEGDTFPALRSGVIVPETSLVKPHIRDFMRVIDANDEQITDYYYRQIYDIDRAALAVSENGKLPEGSFKVREQHAETHRIGWFMFVSKRMLRKISLIQNQIMQLLPSGMARQEDFQILYGDNNDANFNGIVNVALKEDALDRVIYTLAAGDVVKTASYNGDKETMVELKGGHSKMETGMKVTFKGFATATEMNATDGYEIKVMNDHQIVVPCAYVAEADTSAVTGEIRNNLGGLVMDANLGDALKVIAAYLSFDQYTPSLIIINPMTLNTFLGVKDGNGRLMWQDYFQIRNGICYLNGVLPVMTCDAIAKGYVLVGDFTNAAELYDTQRGFIEFAEDVSTKLTNEVCTLIQEEVILAVTCPDAFMYAKIDDVISSINVKGTYVRNVAIVSPLNTDGSVSVTN